MSVFLPVMYASRVSSGTNDQSCLILSVIFPSSFQSWGVSNLVEVDRGLPVVISEQVEVAHTDFTKVTEGS